MRLLAGWGKTGGVSLVAVLLLTGCGASYPESCDDAGVLETLAGAFNSTAPSRATGVTAVDVTDIEDMGGMGDVLSCRGALQLSNGNSLRVGYTVEPDGDDYWVEYQPLGKNQ